MLRSRVALMHLTALLAFGGDPIPGMSWGGQAFELETDRGFPCGRALQARRKGQAHLHYRTHN
jgi:hypothetical protein